MNHVGAKSPDQAGFSLIELMVATLLGTILAAGVVSVYLTSMKDYKLNNALGAVQRNGRLALSLLETKIRMAGFFGCNRGARPESILDSDLATYDLTTAIQGYEYTGTGMGMAFSIGPGDASAETGANRWSPSLPPDISHAIGAGTGGDGAALPGSDILLLHEAIPGGTGLASPYTDSSDGLFVAAGQSVKLSVGQLAVVSDCAHSGLFQISSIAENPQDGNSIRIRHSSDAGLSPGNTPPGEFNDNAYGSDAVILPYQTYLFYIGANKGGSPGLYEASLGAGGAFGKPVELVPGVESMQLLYGVDTDADGIPNQYLTADQIADWNQVVSVRVALLASDGENAEMGGGAASFKLLDRFDGLSLTVPGNWRVRRVFEETVSLRNRLP